MTKGGIMPAIGFEPDGYSLVGGKLMGRQAAGHAFLRAAVAAANDQQTLAAYSPNPSSARVFSAMVQQIRPGLRTSWIPAARLDLLREQGQLYLPGPGLDESAQMRLRLGPLAYSLCGVTHTTASHRAMDAIKGLLSAPVMPWDALICTSTSVLSTVRTVLDRERDYLRWRFGADVKTTLPQLPVIPLGVHTRDYQIDAAERTAARQALGLADDEVVALFVGRLSFHAKAHPHAMYLGLQAAARQTGRRVTLIQSGWFANDAIAKAFKDGAAQTCPDVKALFTDGQDEVARRQSWAAADIFISLSDNIQETFGLTPIEAMAAGLPVVVTDWDGYKDTVRDGEDGYRIPTWMPQAGWGAHLAMLHESGSDNYDSYCAAACQAVAVDLDVLTERLCALIDNPALRQRLGRQARLRAQEVYDWGVVFQRYQALWAEQAEIRAHAQRTAAPLLTDRSLMPRCDAARLDPFEAFAHYPSRHLSLDTVVAWSDAASPEQVRASLEGGLFSYMLQRPAMRAGVEAVMVHLAQARAAVNGGAESIGAVANALSLLGSGERRAVQPQDVMAAVTMLLKIGAVRVQAGS